MKSVPLPETAKYWQSPCLKGLGLLRATYINHSFSRHIHDGYAIGVIEQGALAFSYRGENIVVPSGHINLVIPGEAHDGHAASEAGWAYRMFYLEPACVEQVCLSISGRAGKIAFPSTGTLKDGALAHLIRQSHIMLEQNMLPVIEQESQLLALISALILRHTNLHHHLKSPGQEQPAVKLIREHIEENYSNNISLQSLSNLCNLSPFHLIRVFQNHIGIPPHIYLKQVRIKNAQKLLAQNLSPAFIAQEVGFTDQSHFSKQFKQIIGITPGQYRNSIQNNVTARG
jgi:AraC-like DNA-binding protein